MKNVFTYVLVLLVSICNAQVFTNSAGSGIFFTEKAKQLKAETSFSEKTSKLNLQYNALLPRLCNIKYFVGDSVPKKERKYTVGTSWGLLLKGGLINNGAITKEIKNPSYNAEIGIIKGIDSLNYNLFVKSAYSFGLSAKVQYDNRRVLYDSIQQSLSSEYPYTFSLNGHIEMYPKGYSFLALGLTAGFINSTNFGDLLPFQNNPSDFMDINVISLPKEEDGRIGVLQRTNNFYISFAVPFFLFKTINSDSVFRGLLEKTAITPYAYNSIGDNDAFNVGVSLSIVNNPLNNNKYTKLFDSGFNLGIDWTKQKGTWSEPSIFINGTFAIDGLFDANDEKVQK